MIACVALALVDFGQWFSCQLDGDEGDLVGLAQMMAYPRAVASVETNLGLVAEHPADIAQPVAKLAGNDFAGHLGSLDLASPGLGFENFQLGHNTSMILGSE